MDDQGSDDFLFERVYRIYMGEGLVHLTEQELCKEYIRYRKALRTIALQTEGDVAATCVSIAKETLENDWGIST